MGGDLPSREHKLSIERTRKPGSSKRTTRESSPVLGIPSPAWPGGQGRLQGDRGSKELINSIQPHLLTSTMCRAHTMTHRGFTMRKQPTSVHESCRSGQPCPGHKRAINLPWDGEGPGETKLSEMVLQFPMCKRIVPITEGFSEKLIHVNRA